jgi:hypothetical protein
MSNYSTIAETVEGHAQIMTKSRWMYVVPMPHTSIMPYPCSASDLKRLGTFIKWTTDDPAVLAKLHDSIVSLVQEVGITGMVEIANNAKMTEQIWKRFGGAGSGLQDAVEMAAQEGVTFPMPANALKYLKGFQ